MAQTAVVLTIVVASLALAATKLSSVILLSSRDASGFWKNCLEQTPGTMITALIVPDIVSMGRVGLGAAFVTGMVALVSRSMLATVIAGALAAAGIRAIAGAGLL
jgi:uncharacterized membrane protein